MYEAYTEEYIMAAMLDRVKDADPELDIREDKSLIYTALAPAVQELQNVYIALDMILNECFADTATLPSLIPMAAESGVEFKEATNAVLKMSCDAPVEIGARFSAQNSELNYIVIEEIGVENARNIFKVECETSGEEGNLYLGSVIPIDYIPNLTSATLSKILTEGQDEEGEESLRIRFLSKVQRPSTSGNRHDYYNWAMEVQGVGAVKVYPLALGAGTVKLVITDSDRNAATDELTQKVMDYIEELRPIGATVTIISAKEKKINVTANVKLQEGVNPEDVKDVFSDLLKGYLKENAFESVYVSIARIGNLLLGISDLLDYAQLEINGQTGNIPLNDEEIAVIGTVSLGVL